MALTFVVFVGYGLLAAAIRCHVISRPQVLVWMRRSFAAAFVVDTLCETGSGGTVIRPRNRGCLMALFVVSQNRKGLEREQIYQDCHCGGGSPRACRPWRSRNP